MLTNLLALLIFIYSHGFTQTPVPLHDFEVDGKWYLQNNSDWSLIFKETGQNSKNIRWQFNPEQCQKRIQHNLNSDSGFAVFCGAKDCCPPITSPINKYDFTNMYYATSDTESIVCIALERINVHNTYYIDLTFNKKTSSDIKISFEISVDDFIENNATIFIQNNKMQTYVPLLKYSFKEYNFTSTDNIFQIAMNPIPIKASKFINNICNCNFTETKTGAFFESCIDFKSLGYEITSFNTMNINYHTFSWNISMHVANLSSKANINLSNTQKQNINFRNMRNMLAIPQKFHKNSPQSQLIPTTTNAPTSTTTNNNNGTQPTVFNTNMPTFNPTTPNYMQPTLKPVRPPISANETYNPTYYPTSNPTTPKPTPEPTPRPTNKPTQKPLISGETHSPTFHPTIKPTLPPLILGQTHNPTPTPIMHAPTMKPSLPPLIYGETHNPTANPTSTHVNAPTDMPTMIPTPIPVQIPTTPTTTNPPGISPIGPTHSPLMAGQTHNPSQTPTKNPTTFYEKTYVPTTIRPTTKPLIPSETHNPTIYPVYSPIYYPSEIPTNNPIKKTPTLPTDRPTPSPLYSGQTHAPSILTLYPGQTHSPTMFLPTLHPTTKPTNSPTIPIYSTTLKPTNPPLYPGETHYPSNPPTNVATTYLPTTTKPTLPPLTPDQTHSPSTHPTYSPTSKPTKKPTQNPLTPGQTHNPTTHPILTPTIKPTLPPLMSGQTHSPTINPTYSHEPTPEPTPKPTYAPTMKPTLPPLIPGETHNPTTNPTHVPTLGPTFSPTMKPTFSPTKNPTKFPTINPTISPTMKPTLNPLKSGQTHIPTAMPTYAPTLPTLQPTNKPTRSPLLPGQTHFPTKTPSYNPTKHAPTLQPTLSPTTISGTMELYVFYNESRYKCWNDNSKLYGELIKEAVFISLENITGHSMHYEDKDLYWNTSWRYGGLIDWYICHVFNEDIDDINVITCPYFTNPDPNTETAQFVAVNEFSVVSDNNNRGFKIFVTDIILSDVFIKQFEKVLDKLVRQSNPTNNGTCESDNDETLIIHIDIFEKPDIFSPTFATFKPTKNLNTLESTETNVSETLATPNKKKKKKALPAWAIALILLSIAVLVFSIVFGVYYYGFQNYRKQRERIAYNPVENNIAIAGEGGRHPEGHLEDIQEEHSEVSEERLEGYLEGKEGH